MVNNNVSLLTKPLKKLSRQNQNQNLRLGFPCITINGDVIDMPYQPRLTDLNLLPISTQSTWSKWVVLQVPHASSKLYSI